MFQLKFLKRRWLFCLLLLVFSSSYSLFAQINSTPFEQVFIASNLNKENLKKDFPHLYQVVKNKEYKTEDINSFIKSHEAEWNNFTNVPAVKKLNIAWNTLSLTLPEAKKDFAHPMYQWYRAANISDSKRNQLFQHFPLPNLKNDVDKELAVYAEKIGAWQRLYSEEYEHFLNAPELVALNPYYKGYFTLPYMPKFIGSAISYNKPTKENTNNPVMDDYNYQQKLRNWYFVFKPTEFERLYGKDYKFPSLFDPADYRMHVKTKLEEKKNGQVNPADNH